MLKAGQVAKFNLNHSRLKLVVPIMISRLVGLHASQPRVGKGK